MGLTPPEPWDLVGELQAVVEGRLCRGERREACRREQGPFADWACEVCREYVRPEALSPWTWHLLFLHRLRQGGYPFRADDLSLETWLLLATVAEVLSRGKGKDHGRKQG
jgi:hypothetical protein